MRRTYKKKGIVVSIHFRRVLVSGMHFGVEEVGLCWVRPRQMVEDQHI